MRLPGKGNQCIVLLDILSRRPGMAARKPIGMTGRRPHGYKPQPNEGKTEKHPRHLGAADDLRLRYCDPSDRRRLLLDLQQHPAGHHRHQPFGRAQPGGQPYAGYQKQRLHHFQSVLQRRRVPPPRLCAERRDPGGVCRLYGQPDPAVSALLRPDQPGILRGLPLGRRGGLLLGAGAGGL